MNTGIRKEPSDVYHAEKLPISATPLKAMATSPAHFIQIYRGPSPEPTPAMVEGTIVHSCVLEKDQSKLVVLPEDHSNRTNAGKALVAEIEAAGKIPVKQSFMDTVAARIQSFERSQEAMRLYTGADIEHSFYAVDPETGLAVKARPDIKRAGVIADFKTVATMAGFERQVWNLGYNIQAGFYSMVTELVTGQPIREFYFIAQEKTAPYGVRVFRMPKPLLDQAKAEARILLNRASVHLKENSFPAYDDVVTDLTQPTWHVNADTFGEAI